MKTNFIKFVCCLTLAWAAGHGPAGASSINGPTTARTNSVNLTTLARRTGPSGVYGTAERAPASPRMSAWPVAAASAPWTYLNPNSQPLRGWGSSRSTISFRDNNGIAWPAPPGHAAGCKTTAGRPPAGVGEAFPLPCLPAPASRCWMFLWMSISGSGSSPQN